MYMQLEIKKIHDFFSDNFLLTISLKVSQKFSWAD